MPSRTAASSRGTARASMGPRSRQRGSSTSGAGCATAGRRAPRKPGRRRPTSPTHDSRSPRPWPRAGSSPPKRGCRSRRRAKPFVRATSSCGWPASECASGLAIKRMCSWRAPASGPIATSCVSSSWDVSRRFARSSSCSAATPRPPPPRRRSCQVSLARFPRGCHRSSWSADRTLSPQSGAWPPHSIGFMRPRRHVCRPSP